MVAREAIGNDKATLCLLPLLQCRLAAAIMASVNAPLQTSTEISNLRQIYQPILLTKIWQIPRGFEAVALLRGAGTTCMVFQSGGWPGC